MWGVYEVGVCVCVVCVCVVVCVGVGVGCELAASPVLRDRRNDCVPASVCQ